MVKKSKQFYGIRQWRLDHPVESDIRDLINAAACYADSLVVYLEPDTSEHGKTLTRADDSLTELEMTISRAALAIYAMMETREGRKAAGMKPKGRGRSYRPEETEISDPQVQVVLEMLRGEKDRDAAYAEVAMILDPSEKIDYRTLTQYIDELIRKWGIEADRSSTLSWIVGDKK